MQTDADELAQADKELLEYIYNGSFRFKPAVEKMALEAIALHREAAVARQTAKIRAELNAAQAALKAAGKAIKSTLGWLSDERPA